MSYWEALLFGALQGITEYLPISSSAHLILLPRFLGTEDPGLTFDVFLHVGTLLATLIYFRKEWIAIARGFIKAGSPERGLLILIMLATIPALIVGAAFNHKIETELRGNLVLILTLPIGGLLLWGIDRFKNPGGPLEKMSPRQAVGVGFFQCLALMPGMSRSGSTMLGARFLGLDRSSAARFSFLISAPVTLAAIVFKLRHFRELAETNVGGGQLLVAGLATFVFGLLAIDTLLKLLRKFGFLSFAIYRLALGIVIYCYLGL